MNEPSDKGKVGGEFAAPPGSAADTDTEDGSAPKPQRKSKSFRNNVTWQLVGSVSQALLGGLVLLLMGRELKATGFGVFSIVMAIVYLANALIEPRMQDVAAKQFWNMQSEDADRQLHGAHFIDLLGLEVLGKMLPCLAIIALATPLASVSQLPPGGAALLSIAAVGVYFSKLGYGLALGVLRVLGRSDLFAVCTTTELMLRLGMLIALMQFTQLSVIACVVIVAISGILSNILQWTFVVRQFGSVGLNVTGWTLTAALGRLRQNRKLLLSNLGMSVTDLMNKDLDVTLIAPLVPAGQVGIYKMAKNIVLLAWRAVDPFYIALMPEISRLVSLGDFGKLKRLMAITSAALLALALALSAGTYGSLLFFGDAVLGPAFAETTHLIPWMLVGIVLSAPLVWGHPLSVALNRAEVAFFGSLLGSIVGLVAFLVLVPVYGVRGASLAWAASFSLTFVSIAVVSFARLQQQVRLAS